MRLLISLVALALILLAAVLIVFGHAAVGVVLALPELVGVTLWTWLRYAHRE
ncbi:hypothetical protein [Nocardia ninae]|uniref:hypothetical protein n=1 Tax=Nocardia ninae TaxID=356145 RepID=UPI001649FCA5|nr:hypothetical protein [Nocardia ninae]